MEGKGTGNFHKLITAVELALLNYPADNVDVVREDDTQYLTIMYHDRHNSFAIESRVCTLDGIDTNQMEHYLDSVGVGYVPEW